ALGAIAARGDPDRKAALLPDAVAGRTVVTWAPTGAGDSWDLGAGVTVERRGDELVVTGARARVPEAGQADWLLVAGTLDGAPVQVLVPRTAPGVTLTPLVALDLGRRLADVRLDAVTVPADALVGGGAEALWRLHRQAVVLTAAETVGAMDELFTMTVEYARERVAFGRPIGAFQAIKHLLADQALALEMAKAAVGAAVDAVGLDRDDGPEVAAMTAAAVGDAGNELAQQCLQVHGGIGYTWEHDLHLLLRRIRSNSALYGTPTWHREQLCRVHGLGAPGEEVAR
ncbi:MAG TPA: acyl-CoA dehydrogenase, partial [Acidimicrobiales bacterium]